MGRFLFLLILILVIDLMAFQALRHFASSFSKGGKAWAYGLYWLVPVITLLYLFSFSGNVDINMPKAVRVVLRAMIFTLYFTKLLIAAVILVDDLRRLLFGLLNISFKNLELSTSRSSWMALGALVLGSIPLVSLTYGMARNPYRYRVRRASVRIKDLHPDLQGLRIVQISDIHSGSFLLKEPVEESIRMIMDEKPDIVFFTGDLVNSQAREMEPFEEMFSRIKAPLGVYSVLGNHDYGDYHDWNSREEKEQNFEDLKKTHQRLGWDLLMNEHRRIPVGQTWLNVIGVENYSASPRFHRYGDLAKATTDMPRDTVNILLSHDPSHWDDQVIKDYPEIDLTLSGHTHGFQFGVEIPGFVRWSPVQYVYPRWAGLYQEAAQYLYVNRGLGYLGYPGRVGILPEITQLTLEAA